MLEIDVDFFFGCVQCRIWQVTLVSIVCWLFSLLLKPMLSVDIDDKLKALQIRNAAFQSHHPLWQMLSQTQDESEYVWISEAVWFRCVSVRKKKVPGHEKVWRAFSALVQDAKTTLFPARARSVSLKISSREDSVPCESISSGAKQKHTAAGQPPAIQTCCASCRTTASWTWVPSATTALMRSIPSWQLGAVFDTKWKGYWWWRSIISAPMDVSIFVMFVQTLGKLTTLYNFIIMEYVMIAFLHERGLLWVVKNSRVWRIYLNDDWRLKSRMFKIQKEETNLRE